MKNKQFLFHSLNNEDGADALAVILVSRKDSRGRVFGILCIEKGLLWVEFEVDKVRAQHVLFPIRIFPAILHGFYQFPKTPITSKVEEGQERRRCCVTILKQQTRVLFRR
jgi:hypothetical protein